VNALLIAVIPVSKQAVVPSDLFAIVLIHRAALFLLAGAKLRLRLPMANLPTSPVIIDPTSGMNAGSSDSAIGICTDVPNPKESDWPRVVIGATVNPIGKPVTFQALVEYEPAVFNNTPVGFAEADAIAAPGEIYATNAGTSGWDLTNKTAGYTTAVGDWLWGAVEGTQPVVTTKFLLHMDGDAAIVIDSVGTSIWSFNPTGSGSKLEASAAMFGDSGYTTFTGGFSPYLSSNNIPVIGLEDFTLEGWCRADAAPIANTQRPIIDFRSGGNINNGLLLFCNNGSNNLTYSDKSGAVMGSNVPVRTGAYVSWAIERLNGDTTLYVQGVVAGFAADLGNGDFQQTDAHIGVLNNLLTGSSWDGDIDEVRLTVGEALYQGNYTPAGPFPNT
jgi:hypothetical protein